jgi:hypothetical protein
MKIKGVVAAGLFAMSLLLSIEQAPAQTVNNLNEPGSILVFPLIDNINYQTIVDIANLSNTDVWLQGYMIVHPPSDPYDFEKKDFLVHLTHKEPFYWNTSRPYSRIDVNGVLTQIQGFDDRKGFLFLWAINNDTQRLEIDWDYLKGDGLVLGRGSSFQYNAIPHQADSVVADRVLNLDGVEYTMATSQVMVEGFAEQFVPGMGGKWVVCSLDIDFINSIQPQFDINLDVWNQNEVYASRHLDFYQFEQYDLTDDLQLHYNEIFTPKWSFASVTTSPVWAIFYQTVGSAYSWGGNVWQHPATGVPATVVLPPVSQAPVGTDETW